MRISSRILGFTLVLSLLLGACAHAQSNASAAEQADLYFENGIIYTADGNDSVVESLAVKDGKILFVGSAQDGAQFKANAHEVVDLQGKMMMPGFIDGHFHSVSPDFFDFSLIGILSLDETMKTIEDYVKQNPDKETYYGFGYLNPLFEGEELVNGPKKERLDAICPDKPMVIYAYDGHTAWLNTKALEYCNVTKDTPVTPGGGITKTADGELWGTLQDSAMSYTNDFPLNKEKLKAGLKTFVQRLNAMGYTTIMSPPGNGFFSLPWATYQELADHGELSLRVRGASIVTSWKTDEDLKTLASLKAKYNGDLLKVVGAKLFIDGVVDNRSAFFLEPYADDPTFKGESGWTQAPLNQAIKGINSLDLLAHAHSMGDAATRMALNAIQYSQEQLGKADFRNALTHLQLIAPEDMPRFAELNVNAVANPYWHYKAPHHWDTVEYAFIGERAQHEYPLKSFLDNKIHLSFASDYPVTAAPNPFVAVETGVIRNLVDAKEYGLSDLTDADSPEYLLWPEERLPIKEMLRGYTISGAYAIFEENTTGSLEVGKSADMIVLSQDLLSIDPLKIKDTVVEKTYFMGKEVYSAP